MHNMCPNFCISYTDTFSHLKHCPEYGESHYDQPLLEKTSVSTKKPCMQFLTLSISLQLQALY